MRTQMTFSINIRIASTGKFSTRRALACNIWVRQNNIGMPLAGKVSLRTSGLAQVTRT
jgi:hypothetical protein